MTTEYTTTNVNGHHTQTVENIRQWVDAVHPKNEAVEIRILGITKGNGYTEDRAGWFDDYDKLTQAVKPYLGQANIYQTLNPVKPDLLARANNRLKKVTKKLPLTADTQILHYQYIPIDIDPERVAGISSTDEEKKAAADVAGNVADFLAQHGWIPTIKGDSGNGYHLLYKTYLPNNESSQALIQSLLEYLNNELGTDAVKIDCSVHNPSRIWKLYGTKAVKGDNVPTRPHRMAKIFDHNEDANIVTHEMIEAVLPKDAVPTLPKQGKPKKQATTNGDGYTKEAIQNLLKNAGISYTTKTDTKGRLVFSLGKCLTSEEHTDGAAITLENGKAGYKCHHDSCQGKGWQVAKGNLGIETKSKSNPLSYKLTDLGNSERFIAQHSDNLRYVVSWGEWLVWTGKRWERDRIGKVIQLGKETIRSIYHEVAQIDDTDKRQQLSKWAMKSEAANRIKSMIELAQTDPAVAIHHDQLDHNKWLLNCQNGTINLKTGECKKHNKADLITRLVPVEYDINAECQKWLAFLDRVLSDNDEMIQFIQRAVGYTLTSENNEQCLFFMYGTGRNGKSTFIETITALMGDYWKKIPTDALMLSYNGNNGSQQELARLPAVRMVSAAETEQGKRLSESLVKDLTGGDTITARMLYRSTFEFNPVFKLWMYGNHKPIIRGDDDGIWRRIRLIPFKVQIPKNEVNKNLLNELKAELPGILQWAIQGCLEWGKNGLNEPPEVDNATAAYRADMDSIAAFIDDCCIVGDSHRTAPRSLYSTYKEWCTDNNEYQRNNRTFKQLLEDKGYVQQKSNGNRFWQGLGLRND